MRKDGRLNIRLTRELADKAHAHAKARHTTVSTLVEQFLLHLVETEAQKELTSVEPAEQI